ncbi:hypothetical protein TNCV_2891431 [Trichonephila clavipes]|nr:hypothetical protein TNCV_2891431 [Trichonephila clavipes]
MTMPGSSFNLIPLGYEDNLGIRWYYQFETTVCLCKEKNTRSTRAETGSAYDALQLWPFPQFEESEPNNFIW